MTHAGVHAVFPPRSGVRVGDIYVQPAGTAPGVLGREGRLLPSDLWAGRLEVADAPLGDDPAEPLGFAGLTAAGSDLAALLPIEALALIFGATWRAQHEVSLRAGAVRTRSLPVADLLSAAAGAGGRLPAAVTADLSMWLQGEAVRAPGQAAPLGRLLDLAIISSVCEAQSVEIEIATRDSPAAGLLAAVAGNAASDPAELAGALNARLDRLGVEIARGSFRFQAAAGSTVSARRDFPEPVVVGCRFLALRVDPESGALAKPLTVT